MMNYNYSINNTSNFWKNIANTFISWINPFDVVLEGSFDEANVKWFVNGKLNVSYNCIDRHLKNNPNKIAVIWEQNNGNSNNITYLELHNKVCKIANVLKSNGVKKGDVVTLYMSMVPELLMTMLACSRIGAIHSVVFAGFSSESLTSRIIDCNSKYLISQEYAKRGNKIIPLRDICELSMKDMPKNTKLFIFGLDKSHENIIDMDFFMKTESPECKYESMNSDDPLFILYTSGSTGTPKGIVHTTGGYIVNAAFTTKRSFDVKDNDIFGCMADCGWITGHTYCVYGPLSLGITTILFEGIPTFPDSYRYFNLIEKHKPTQFYVAPTAIRSLMHLDTKQLKKYNLSSLRILGTVGEPINIEAWNWFNEYIGRKNCPIVDTYWQTETGSHIAANIPHIMSVKPTSCALPYLGLEFAVLDNITGTELKDNNVEGVLCIKNPWPSMAKTIYGNHERFIQTYMNVYRGYYFTGDGCRRDKDGYYFITGRVDDVINPSGHRISTTEIESILSSCDGVNESAVIGFPHDIKGEGIGCFITPSTSKFNENELTKILKQKVRNVIGAFATLDFIIFTKLPKTRSGKIIRRILRKISSNKYNEIGDISTLSDPLIVKKIISLYEMKIKE